MNEGRPIACTLSGADMKARLQAIASLNRDALRARSREELTLLLEYDRSAAERVREFVRLEQACCAFLRFDVDETPSAVMVRVTAPAEAAAAADALFEEFSAGGAVSCECC